MTGKAILEALSFVEEKYIEEAESGTIRKPKLLTRLLPLAACLCLVFFVLYTVPQQAENSEAGQNEAIHETLADVVDEQVEMNKEPDHFVEERPSLILRIESWEGLQFKATVAKLVDTEIIPIGTKLTVVLKTDPTWVEYGVVMDEDISEIALDPGDLVHVQFYQYDAATATIWVDWLRPCEEVSP